MFALDREALIPRPIDEVFSFFADAGNLERITPPWLRFRILTPLPLAMQAGTQIDYTLRLHGAPIRWRTRITEWEPPHRFVDMQERGPYRLWRHTHTFETRDDGTLMRDHVDYDMIGGRLVDRLLVRRDLDRIFNYRQQQFHEIMGMPCANAAP